MTTHTTDTAIPPTSEPAAATAGLTGAATAVYTALVGTPGTTAEIAVAAGVGRSTAGKALVALEERGLATRTPGEHQGGHRLPDRWHPAQPDSPVTEPQPETVNDSRGPATDRAAETAAASTVPHRPNPEHTDQAEGSDDHESPASEGASLDSAPSETSDVPRGEQPPKTDPNATQSTAPAAAVTPPPSSHKTRLAPGALRQMVIDHLTAHPDQAFTATAISRVIEKSSGAIANALVTLVTQDIAEQVSEKPRQYQLSTAHRTHTN